MVDVSPLGLADYPPPGCIAPSLKPLGLVRIVLKGLEQRSDRFSLTPAQWAAE